MQDFKSPWKEKIAAAVNALAAENGLEFRLEAENVAAEEPPEKEFGDVGFPVFGYAKIFRRGPQDIARMIADRLALDGATGADAKGPYVNVFLDRGECAGAILAQALSAKDADAENAGDGDFGRPGTLAGQRIMVEFSSPNTNKPLHLGHLRNDALGESISRILKKCGAEVRKVCIINDRGIHICKSMLAYREYGAGKTPESEHKKSDHFVGDFYVAFSRELSRETEALAAKMADAPGFDKKRAGAEAPLQKRAQELLRKWEAGDSDTVELWKKMNAWTVSGMKETYARTGISFDQYYFESETYLKGKEEILSGLESGIFFRAEDGAVMVDLEAEKLGIKALLRADGTSIYITQDIGLAIYRYRDWPFSRLVYVVGSEQQYHFQVLFSIFRKLGFEWAQNLHHLSYGMVNLPEGKMKSREGTVVDADDLLDSLRDMAREEIREKEREEAVGDPAEVAEKVALGALHYYLLQTGPQKDMLFDPKESLSFNGSTGPYLQYMGARISALSKKAAARGFAAGDGFDAALLSGDAEWELLKAVAAYGGALAEAAARMDPSVLAGYLYGLSKCFSRFYHDCPVLGAENAELTKARLALCRATERVLRDALDSVCIPFLEMM